MSVIVSFDQQVILDPLEFAGLIHPCYTHIQRTVQAIVVVGMTRGPASGTNKRGVAGRGRFVGSRNMTVAAQPCLQFRC